MNQAEYLAHSSGPWKKHKYFQKIGEGAKAIYKYKVTGEGYKEDEQKALNSYNDASNAALDDKEKQKKAQARADLYSSVSKSQYKQGEAADRRGYYFEKEASNIGGTSVENWKKSLKADAKREHDTAREHYAVSNKAYEKAKKSQTDAAHYSQSSSANAHRAQQMKKRAAQASNDYKTKSLKGATESAISRGQAKINKLLGRG